MFTLVVRVVNQAAEVGVDEYPFLQIGPLLSWVLEEELVAIDACDDNATMRARNCDSISERGLVSVCVVHEQALTPELRGRCRESFKSIAATHRATE